MADIKAIIFDMGGVVFNAKAEELYKVLAKKLKINEVEFDSVKNKYIKDAQRGKISAEELLIKISSELNLNKNKLREFWEEAFQEVMVVNKEVMNVVDILKKNEYITALITNMIEIHSLLSKKRGVYTKFHPVLLSSESGMIKPEKEMYEKMLDLLKLKADECVFIDDREEHLVPAIDLGMGHILFKNALQLKEDLRKYGVKI